MNVINSSEHLDADRRSPAFQSLEREYRRLLNLEESVLLARTATRLQTAAGWSEARASAVLADSVRRWLGSDVVTLHGFYTGAGAPLEVFALVGGELYFTYEGFRTPDQMMSQLCERHRARFSQSRFGPFDASNPGPRIAYGDAQCARVATRLAEILSEVVDPDVARLVLGL